MIAGAAPGCLAGLTDAYNRAMYDRIFAAGYDRIMKGAERSVYPAHRTFVAGGAEDRVLEIGAGTGANLAYYPESVSLTLMEPNPHMLKRLKARAAEQGREAEFFERGAEDLPFADGAFDTVVSTLVLCTVGDQSKTLTEIRRVLSPGGAFRFAEHVRSASRGWGWFQDAAMPLWGVIGAGCHPNRNTVAAMGEAGLVVEDLRTFAFGPYPVRPHVAGVARRG